MKKMPNNTFFALVEEEIENGKSVRFRLKGNSMFPLLRNGKDTVILEKCPTDHLKPMDVVLFRYRGNHVLHRIIKRNGNKLLIQGDGAIQVMEQCNVKDVVGKVTSICRPSGKTTSVESWRWKLYSFLWVKSVKFRPYLLKILHLFKNH